MAQALRERLRRREVLELVVEFCAFLGHGPAQVALDRPTPAGEFLPWHDWEIVLPPAFWQVATRFGAQHAREVAAELRTEASDTLEAEQDRSGGPDQGYVDHLETGLELSWLLEEQLAQVEEWARGGCQRRPPWRAKLAELIRAQVFRCDLDRDSLTPLLDLIERFPEWEVGVGWFGLLCPLLSSTSKPALAESAVPLLLGQPLCLAQSSNEGDYLRSRARRGGLSQSALELAARAGHPGAGQATGVAEVTLERLLEVLAAQPWALLIVVAQRVWAGTPCDAPWDSLARDLVRRDAPPLLRTLEARASAPAAVVARWEARGSSSDPTVQLEAVARQLQSYTSSGVSVHSHVALLQAVLRHDPAGVVAGMRGLLGLFDLASADDLQRLEELDRQLRSGLIRELLGPKDLRVDYEELWGDDERASGEE